MGPVSEWAPTSGTSRGESGRVADDCPGGEWGGHGLPEELGFLSKGGALSVGSSEDQAKHPLHPQAVWYVGCGRAKAPGKTAFRFQLELQSGFGTRGQRNSSESGGGYGGFGWGVGDTVEGVGGWVGALASIT